MADNGAAIDDDHLTRPRPNWRICAPARAPGTRYLPFV